MQRGKKAIKKKTAKKKAIISKKTFSSVFVKRNGKRKNPRKRVLAFFIEINNEIIERIIKRERLKT